MGDWEAQLGWVWAHEGVKNRGGVKTEAFQLLKSFMCVKHQSYECALLLCDLIEVNRVRQMMGLVSPTPLRSWKGREAGGTPRCKCLSEPLGSAVQEGDCVQCCLGPGALIYSTIEPQNHRIIQQFGLKGVFKTIQAETPSTRAGCLKPHPTWT